MTRDARCKWRRTCNGIRRWRLKSGATTCRACRSVPGFVATISTATPSGTCSDSSGPFRPKRWEEYQALGVGFDETVGLSGLERQFQGALRGADGSRKVQIDALGRELNELESQAPVEGRHLVLTVSVREQRAIREILARHLALRDAGAGVAVVIRPEDGSVVALASLPDYDNNAFGAGGDPSVLTRLVTDPRRPLINHAVAGLYPPGSSYKVIAASAALETGNRPAADQDSVRRAVGAANRMGVQRLVGHRARHGRPAPGHFGVVQHLLLQHLRRQSVYEPHRVRQSAAGGVRARVWLRRGQRD